MDARSQTYLILHGAIVLLLGALFGFPLAGALESGTGAVHAWNVAHSVATATGVLLIATGCALGHVTLGPRAGTWLSGSLLIAAWGAMVSVLIGATANVRGFDPGGGPANMLMFAANLCVVFGSLVAPTLLGMGAWNRLRATE